MVGRALPRGGLRRDRRRALRGPHDRGLQAVPLRQGAGRVERGGPQRPRRGRRAALPTQVPAARRGRRSRAGGPRQGPQEVGAVAPGFHRGRDVQVRQVRLPQPVDLQQGQALFRQAGPRRRGRRGRPRGGRRAVAGDPRGQVPAARGQRGPAAAPDPRPGRPLVRLGARGGRGPPPQRGHRERAQLGRQLRAPAPGPDDAPGAPAGRVLRYRVRQRPRRLPSSRQELPAAGGRALRGARPVPDRGERRGRRVAGLPGRRGAARRARLRDGGRAAGGARRTRPVRGAAGRGRLPPGPELPAERGAAGGRRGPRRAAVGRRPAGRPGKPGGAARRAGRRRAAAQGGGGRPARRLGRPRRGRGALEDRRGAGRGGARPDPPAAGLRAPPAPQGHRGRRAGRRRRRRGAPGGPGQGARRLPAQRPPDGGAAAARGRPDHQHLDHRAPGRHRRRDRVAPLGRARRAPGALQPGRGRRPGPVPHRARGHRALGRGRRRGGPRRAGWLQHLPGTRHFMERR